MAGTPQYKVYDPSGKYQAAVKEPEIAAVLVAFYGKGATIRAGHKHVMWTEGSEEFRAEESYDAVARAVRTREDALAARYGMN